MTEKIYYVRVPFTGYYTVEVEKVDGEKEAIEKAMDLDIHLTIENSNKLPGCPEIVEWNTHKQIVQGNFFCGTLNKVDVEVEELEDENGL